MFKIVPFELFAKEGMPEKIFEEVKKGEPKVVVDGDEKVCVLLPPEVYMALVREAEGL